MRGIFKNDIFAAFREAQCGPQSPKSPQPGAMGILWNIDTDSDSEIRCDRPNRSILELVAHVQECVLADFPETTREIQSILSIAKYVDMDNSLAKCSRMKTFWGLNKPRAITRSVRISKRAIANVGLSVMSVLFIIPCVIPRAANTRRIQRPKRPQAVYFPFAHPW